MIARWKRPALPGETRCKADAVAAGGLSRRLSRWSRIASERGDVIVDPLAAPRAGREGRSCRPDASSAGKGGVTEKSERSEPIVRRHDDGACLRGEALCRPAAGSSPTPWRTNPDGTRQSPARAATGGGFGVQTFSFRQSSLPVGRPVAELSCGQFGGAVVAFRTAGAQGAAGCGRFPPERADAAAPRTECRETRTTLRDRAPARRRCRSSPDRIAHLRVAPTWSERRSVRCTAPHNRERSAFIVVCLHGASFVSPTRGQSQGVPEFARQFSASDRRTVPWVFPSARLGDMTLSRRRQARTVRDPVARRRRRDGRGLPRPATRASIGSSPSSCCRSELPIGRIAGSGSRSKRARSHRSAIRTSARSSTSASRTARAFLVMEYLEGETLDDRLDARAAAGRTTSLRYAIADRRCARSCAPRAHRPSRPETEQRDAHAVGREAARLRPGATAASPSVAPSLSTVVVRQREADRGRHHPRNLPIHGAGAARGQGRRRAHRHLRVRRAPLRDGDGTQGVRRQEPGEPDRVDPDRAAATDLRRRVRSGDLPPALDHVVERCLAKSPTIAGRRRATSSWSWTGSPAAARGRAVAPVTVSDAGVGGSWRGPWRLPHWRSLGPR